MGVVLFIMILSSLLKIFLNIKSLDWNFFTGFGTLLLAIAAFIGIIYTSINSKQNQKLIEETSYTRIQEVETKVFPKIRISRGIKVGKNISFRIYYYEELLDLEVRLYAKDATRLYPESGLIIKYITTSTSQEKEKIMGTLEFSKEHTKSIKLICPYKDPRNNHDMPRLENIIEFIFSLDSKLSLGFIYLKLYSIYLNEYEFLYEDASSENLFFRRIYTKYPWKGKPWFDPSNEKIKILDDKIEIRKNKTYESAPKVNLRI